MADTLQVVQWALEQGCALRAGDAITDPAKAAGAIARAQTYSKYLVESGQGWGLFGDVCVTAYTYPPPRPKLGNRSLTYPSGGFLVSEAFKSVGGAACLTAMCAACPANTHKERPAGCAGMIFQHPDAPQTQEQLEGILSRLGLHAAFAEAFPQTDPIWYGLWARSPLSVEALRLLRVIVGAMHDEDHATLEGGADGLRRDHLAELRAFVRATELAERWDLRLSVRLAPPGHTDFGFYTVFPHCPFCKAEATLERWQRKYPAQLYTCQVCGTQYPPAETASSERDDWAPDELRALLGDRFPAFAREYLMTQGVTESQAAAIVESSEAWNREREREGAELRRRSEKQDRFIAAELFAGLHPQYDEADDEAAGDSATRSHASAQFNPAEFAELLNRCEAKGVRVTVMLHRSEDPAMDRSGLRGLSRPKKVLAKWQAEGCHEWFSAVLNVPDALLDRFQG